MVWISTILTLLAALFCRQVSFDEATQVRIITDEALAAATIWQEAAGEPYEGKLAVASVIRNRMKRKYQSDGTVAGTVLKDYQFSGWNVDPKDTLRERSMLLDDENQAVKDCIRAWRESQYDDVTNGAVLYFAPKGVKKTPAWAEAPSVKFVKAIHNHHFYQDVA